MLLKKVERNTIQKQKARTEKGVGMTLRYLINLLGACFLMLANVSYAAINLEDIQFTELPDNRIELRTVFSAPPTQPQGYAIEKPARIVLDLPGVQSTLQQKKYTLGLGNANSAVILTAKDRTRLILNLNKPASYSSRIEGNVLITVIDSSLEAGKTFTRDQKKQLSNQPTVQRTGNLINNVDFRRGEDGSGQLLLALADPKVSVDVEKTASDIQILFVDTNIPERLQRRLDVIDFATPVQFIETVTEGDNVRVTIDALGQYDYLAYQADGNYVISIAPLSAERIEEQQARFKFVGEKLSLNFQDIEVRKVLEIIADFTELNLVASDTVQGNITLRLENVPWDQALELVLKSKGLDKRQSGNVLLVAPAVEIAERERQELESRQQLQELEPLTTEFIQVRYANASDILELIGGASAGEADAGTGVSTTNVLSARGSAAVDERTNAIILTDIPANIEGIKALIEKVDIPVRQVMIDARIVIANTDFSKELGTRLGGTLVGVTQSAGGAGFESSGSLESLEGFGPSGFFAGTEERDLNDALFVDLPAANSAGSFLLSIFSRQVVLDLELSALESSGYAEVVSQPRVITGDKQEARIESGQQVPYTSTSSDGTTTIFRDATLSLNVTPQITPDNRVLMDINVNQDSIGETTTNGPAINVTQLETNVLVGDGETVVLGGIFQETKSEQETKIPLLGDIPVVGRLFRRESKVDDKQELLIFITPRILSDSLLDQ